MEWKVAPSYQNGEILEVNETDKKANVKLTCDRCSGLGIIVSRVENGQPIPIPVDGGICYKCNGIGSITKWVKAYTPEEFEKYIQAQKRSREKELAKREAIRQEKEENSEINRRAKLIEWGYDPENPEVFLIGGGNTYHIKDQLKENGCRFSPELGWYCSHDIDVPEGYKTVAVPFENIFEWNPYWENFSTKKLAKETAAAAIASLSPKSSSEWVGKEKERLRDMEVRYTGARVFNGAYGTTFIYSFLLNKKDILTWFTTSQKNLIENESYLLTGTVKKFSEYNGVKTTVLSRCIIKEVA